MAWEVIRTFEKQGAEDGKPDSYTTLGEAVLVEVALEDVDGDARVYIWRKEDGHEHIIGIMEVKEGLTIPQVVQVFSETGDLGATVVPYNKFSGVAVGRVIQ